MMEVAGNLSRLFPRLVWTRWGPRSSRRDKWTFAASTWSLAEEPKTITFAATSAVATNAVAMNAVAMNAVATNIIATNAVATNAAQVQRHKRRRREQRCLDQRCRRCDQ